MLENIPITDYNKIIEGINLQHKYHVTQVQDANASIILSLQKMKEAQELEIHRLEKKIRRRRK
jgi:hypothetical protein